MEEVTTTPLIKLQTEINTLCSDVLNSVNSIIDLETFLEVNYNGHIILLTKTNYQHVRRPLLVIIHNFKSKYTKLKKWMDRLYEVTKMFLKVIQFAVADLEDITLFHFKHKEAECTEFNLNSEPYIFAVDTDEHQHQFKEVFRTDVLTHFCEKLKQNELYHSDPIPDLQNDPHEETIVADNFIKFVENNKKDVFVTLHSNQSLMYRTHMWTIPKKLGDDEDILVFYKINTETNYIPLKYKVSEYPTSFLIPYKDRSLCHRYVHSYYDNHIIRRFIAKYTSTELKTLDRKGRTKIPNFNPYNKSTKGSDYEINCTLENLKNLILRKLPNDTYDNNKFFEFLNSLLNKIEEADRDDINVNLLTLASTQVKAILEKSSDS